MTMDYWFGFFVAIFSACVGALLGFIISKINS